MATSQRLFSALAAAAVLTACGGKPAPEQPAPQPAQPEAPAPAPAPAASTSDADRDRAERDRLAREAADRAARERSALLEQLSAIINFEFDKFDIRSDDEANLDRKAAILGANGGVRVQVAGHADERGSDEYNLALGNRRAAAAKRYLVNKGIDAGRLDVVSYGEERPLDPGHDESAWTKNRRDEFEPTAGADNLVAPR